MNENKIHLLRVSVITLLLFWVCDFAFAQQGKSEEEWQKHCSEMKAYMKENMLPRISEQRAKLDQDLTAQEKQELEQIRQDFKQLMNEKKEFHQKMKSGESLSSQDWDNLRDAYTEKHRLMAQAFEIEQEHHDRINELLEELEADAVRWQGDMHKMKEEWKKEKMQQRSGGSDKDGKSHEGWKGHHKMHGHHHGGPMHMMDPVHFLLFDPEHMEEMMEEGK